MKSVRVDLWSDFVCPWCWIAKRRLDQAIEQMAVQIEVSVSNHSYRLAKGMEPMDFGAALVMKFGDEQAAHQMMQAVKAQGSMEGLVYNFHTMRFGDTGDAHALVKNLGDEAMRSNMIEALSQASVTDGRDIFDREVLRDIAAEVGLSAEEIAAISFDQVDGIEQDEVRANSIANGVPLFVFNDSLYLSGAQPVETFVAALNQAALDAPAIVEAEKGAGCDSDGCRI